jgi:hypothetical protein
MRQQDCAQARSHNPAENAPQCGAAINFMHYLFLPALSARMGEREGPIRAIAAPGSPPHRSGISPGR